MRERYTIFVLLMVLIAVAFFTLTSRSMEAKMQKVSDLDNKIKTSQEKLNSARIMDQELSQFALIIDNSLTKTQKLTFDEVNEFKTKIGEMAHQRKISINKMSDTNKFSLPNLIETTYNLELEASYVQIGQFISDLEAQDNIIKIHALDISPAQITGKDTGTAGNVSRYKVTIELSVFKVKKEA